nr:thrombospondin type 3 repeat-containing protein [Halorubellus salinus]
MYHYAGDYDCEYAWDTFPESGEVGTPSVTLRVPTTDRRETGYDFVERDDWALVYAPLETTYRTDTGNHPTPVANASDPRTTANASFFRTGVASDGILYFGAATVESWAAGGETVRLVVPSRTSVDVPAVRATVEAAAQNLSIGDREGTMTLFAAPDPIRGGGQAFWTDVAWVHEDAEAGDAHNVWVHEYVHTRQRWQLDERVAWLTEGSAEYYAALASYRQGSLSFEGFYDHVATDHGNDVVLANPDATGWGTATYTKGRRVLAALDRKVRLATDGNRTVADVLYLVNRHDGEVTYGEFQEMVERVAGTSFDPWLDRHVTTDAAPGVAYRSGWLTPAPSDRDADNDGANESVEKARWLDPFDADTDGDGLDDGREVATGTSPVESDTDDDGVSDRAELVFGETDPTVADTDGDGLDDGTERYDSTLNGTLADTDDDGLNDSAELQAGTDPSVRDTDDDGLADGREVTTGTNATVADTDGDGLDDGAELQAGTDPTVADTDGDGLDDATEVDGATDPTAADTDGDGLDDATEVDGATDPTAADTDDDGLVDGEDPNPTRPRTTTASTPSDDGPTPGFGATTALAVLLTLALVASRRTR